MTIQADDNLFSSVRVNIIFISDIVFFGESLPKKFAVHASVRYFYIYISFRSYNYYKIDLNSRSDTFWCNHKNWMYNMYSFIMILK